MLTAVFIINIISFLINLLYVKSFLHLFQLKDYNNKRYLNYFRIKHWFIYLLGIVLFVCEVVLHGTHYLDLWFVVVCKTILLIFNFAICNNLIISNKTPIKYTGKIKRIFALCGLSLALCACFKFGAELIFLVMPILPIFTNTINFYDKLLNRRFIKKAQNRLKEINPKIIAITGSNGKTSIKNILLQMLEGKFCYATPKSYNTPLGISLFINNQLSNDCKYLILEYGARKRGDVKKLCKTFGADYGICSLVAPQHLESFKNINNIYLTKKELSNFLGSKLCIFNLDNTYTKKMHLLKTGKKLGVSIKSYADFYATNIKVTNFTTSFNLVINNTTYTATTKLLGRHNVTNILLATALALHIGVNIKDLLNIISNLQPTPHRLEYIKGNLNILDDSYNCSIASAEESLWVLAQTENKKMVCTPGIIEGGKHEYEINFKLGELCAESDYVVIVGEHNKKAISNGLKNKNFNSKNLFLVPTLEDAKKHFGILKENDTLLLLNDLPDDYN